MFTQLLFSGFFQRPTAQAPGPIFTQNTSNDVVPRKDVPLGLENKNLTFKPSYSRKTAILGPGFDGTIFVRKPLYNGGAPCKLPLIVIVAP